MSEAFTGREQEQESDVETALLDAELFLKYHAPERALRRLRTALEASPRSIALRERLREITRAKHPEEAARQCLALASLYIEREELQTAHDRLLEAKNLDPRISIAPGLEAIRRARRPELRGLRELREGEVAVPANRIVRRKSQVTLAGDLSAVSIFDAVQVIENARLTGALAITSDSRQGRVLFNEGRIVGAESAGQEANAGLRRVLEKTDGEFDFERAPQPFPVTIQAHSNTNLLLDTLRELDEEKQK
jgi:tetratricopeptide (TPR) repeat protein